MRCRDSPSFVKFLIDDNFEEEIRIPPAFTKEFREFSRKWVLKTDLFNRTWYVKLEYHGRDYYLCKLSWPDFVKNHRLRSGDLLLFRYVGVSADDLSKFDILLYSASGLSKVITSPPPTLLAETSDSYPKQAEILTQSVDSARPKRNRQETSRDPQLKRYLRSQTSKLGKSRDHDHAQVKEEQISDSEEELERDNDIKSNANVEYFQVVFKFRSIQRLPLPAHMVKRITAKNIKALLLIDESGRKWKVELCPTKDGRILMGKGWAAFRNDKDLKEGDEYKFTLIQNEKNMILVRKLEEVYEVA